MAINIYWNWRITRFTANTCENCAIRMTGRDNPETPRPWYKKIFNGVGMIISAPLVIAAAVTDAVINLLLTTGDSLGMVDTTHPEKYAMLTNLARSSTFADTGAGFSQAAVTFQSAATNDANDVNNNP